MTRAFMIRFAIALLIPVIMTACGTQRDSAPLEETVASRTVAPSAEPSAAPQRTATAGITDQADTPEAADEPAGLQETGPAEESDQPVIEEESEKVLQMWIGDTAVAVEWENNESVEALKGLCEETPLVIQMSMYGGFEQVGPVGSRLPSNDVQTKTSSGDIVLYSSSQIVVFYGSNSWSYTRLGRITDQDADGMASLLGNGDVTITISLEEIKKTF